jgi:hypothetical protein
VLNLMKRYVHAGCCAIRRAANKNLWAKGLTSTAMRQQWP